MAAADDQHTEQDPPPFPTAGENCSSHMNFTTWQDGRAYGPDGEYLGWFGHLPGDEITVQVCGRVTGGPGDWGTADIKVLATPDWEVVSQPPQGFLVKAMMKWVCRDATVRATGLYLGFPLFFIEAEGKVACAPDGDYRGGIYDSAAISGTTIAVEVAKVVDRGPDQPLGLYGDRDEIIDTLIEQETDE